MSGRSDTAPQTQCDYAPKKSEIMLFNNLVDVQVTCDVSKSPLDLHNRHTMGV